MHLRKKRPVLLKQVRDSAPVHTDKSWTTVKETSAASASALFTRFRSSGLLPGRRAKKELVGLHLCHNSLMNTCDVVVGPSAVEEFTIAFRRNTCF
jgi:hypothetical protein